MKKLELNREYLKRHLFVVLVFASVGGWFAYDGYVKYPRTPAEELYTSIEGSPPPEGTDLVKFKKQKTDSQRIFAAFLLFAAFTVGMRLARNAAFRFSWDENSFTLGGRGHGYEAVVKTDFSKWEKSGIMRVTTSSGRFVLDSWHHSGVDEFRKELLKHIPGES